MNTHLLHHLPLRHVAVLLATCSAVTLSADEPNWPQFRGPGARGISQNEGLPDTWTATENVAWKTDLPGRGWSSPIVWGRRVFLTSVINTGESEAPKKGLYFGGDRPKPPTSEHLWQVTCLDLETGERLWEQTVHRGTPAGSIHLKNSFASETPITDGERIYCLFGNQGIYCFTLEGQPVWSQPLPAHKTRFGWGTAASLALHGDHLYYCNDNDEDSYLAAIDKRTGNEAWRTQRDEKSNWATPYVWAHADRTELVTPGTQKVRSYDLQGKLLWELTGMSSITIATPYEHNGLLYISSGYVMDKLKPVYAIRPGATGDITLADDATSNDSIAWCNREIGPYNPSTIIYRDLLYVLLDRGMFNCYDAATGEKIYQRQRLPEGQAFTSSPWAYGGKLFCLNEDGITYVIEAGKEFKLLHTNALAEDDMCMATPAIAGDRLLLRTAARLYCIRQPR